MNLELSWDLFVIVFFVVIMAYSFIIGRASTLKIILTTYVAALSADAAGSFLGFYVNASQTFMKILEILTLGNEQEVIVFTKIVIFVILVILLTVKGAFEVEEDKASPLMQMALSIIYAVMSSGLIISIILVFVSGASFIGGGDVSSASMWHVYAQSPFIRSLASNSHFWFSLPVVVILIHSYSAKK